MPNINKYRIAIAVLAVVVVILAILLFIGNGREQPMAESLENLNASTTGQVTSTPPAGTAPAGTGTSAPAPARAPQTGFVIRLQTPIAGETWTIAQQNIISWTPKAGVTGQIELLNASTKALVGVIIPQTGPNQTSYSWNTRDLTLSRTNPLKKNVTPGTYVVRLVFDGNNLSPVTSGAFTIAQ